jgi:hypothetical protein
VRTGPGRGTFAKRYLATYDAGYETPNQSATGAEALPSMLRMGTKFVFKAMWGAARRDLSITREHLLRGSFWYDDGNTISAIETYLSGFRSFAQST